MATALAHELALAREDAESIFDEIRPLIIEHYEEIAHYQDIPLDPDWDAYAAASRAGNIRVFTARAGGRLIGYAVFFVRMNLHYKSSLQAVQDILFVHPDHRGQGLRLIRYADRYLKAEGVQVVYQHIKAAHNFGPALERMGYELMDLIYSKRLDKEGS